jgi:hypothetical protein
VPVVSPGTGLSALVDFVVIVMGLSLVIVGPFALKT